MTEFVSGYGRFHSNEPTAKNPKPYTSIGWPQIIEMVNRPQEVNKSEAQWVIPSTLPTRNHVRQAENGEFWMLWADLDENTLPISELAANLELGILNGAKFEIYTSKSATVNLQKCRILVPLDKPLNGEDWRLCQTIFNNSLEEMGIEPDPATEATGQILFLPNRGEFYETASNRSGPLFQPLVEWAGALSKLRAEKREQAAKREAQKQAAVERRAAVTEESVGRNLIDVFNDMVDVGEVLQRAGYDQDGDRFRHPKSESGSFSATVMDGRVHSLSSADPLFTGGSGGGAHDAFSAFEILFANGDRGEALKLAGNQWLTIDGVAWNAAKRREYAREKAQGTALEGFEDLGDTEGQKKRFALLTPREMRGRPPLRWLIKDILPESGVAAIYGPSGSGKSFLALDMLGAIAGGVVWFGNRVVRNVPVIYVGLEGEAGLSLRMQAWQKVHGELPDSFRTVISHLDIRKDADRKALAKEILGAGYGGCVLVVDTLNQSAVGLDENDSSAMGLAIGGVNALQREIGGLVVLIHHSGKDQSKGLRGHSSLGAALDSSIEVSRSKEARSWSVAKLKDGEDGRSFGFTLDTIVLGVDDDLDEITSCVVRPDANPAKPEIKPPSGKNQILALEVLQGMFDEAGGLAEERPRIPYENAIQRIGEKLPEDTPKAKRICRAREAVDGLLKKGSIELSDGFLIEF